MRKASFADMHCSIAQSLEIVGEWWTLLILRDAFLGVRRFEDFVSRLGIARNVLTNRLDTLVEAEVLERRAYDEPRGRYDYVLTEKGRALWPVMTALRQWGDEWIVGEDAAPVLLEHRVDSEHSHRTTAVMACDECGETLDIRPSKVVCGLEPESTNLFLQALARAATSGVDSSKAVDTALKQLGLTASDAPTQAEFAEVAAVSPDVIKTAQVMSQRKLEKMPMRHAEKAEKVYAGETERVAMTGDDIAEVIHFVTLGLGRHVNVNRIELMPERRGFGQFTFDRS